MIEWMVDTGCTTMIDASWYRRPPGVFEHTSAGGVIVRLIGGRVYVALVQEGERPLYALPKGHVEEEEDLVEAARREIAEESGLVALRLLDDLGVRQRLDYRKSSWKKTHYFLFLTDQDEGAESKVADWPTLSWFPIERLPPMFWPEQRELIVSNRDRIVALAEAADKNQ